MINSCVLKPCAGKFPAEKRRLSGAEFVCFKEADTWGKNLR